MLRKEESDKGFRKKLQNAVNPINKTDPSPEMEDYLKKMNDGTLQSEETLKKEARDKKMEEENKKYTLFCPTCRRPTLKKGPQGYVCNFCGLTTNGPLRMATK